MFRRWLFSKQCYLTTFKMARRSISFAVIEAKVSSVSSTFRLVLWTFAIQSAFAKTPAFPIAFKRGCNCKTGMLRVLLDLPGKPLLCIPMHLKTTVAPFAKESRNLWQRRRCRLKKSGVKEMLCAIRRIAQDFAVSVHGKWKLFFRLPPSFFNGDLPDCFFSIALR